MKKKRYFNLVLALTVLASVLAASDTVYAQEDAWVKGYTYNYDYWGDIQYCPDAYDVAGVFTAVDIGLEDGFKSPSGMFARGNRVYICDTGNNRILEIERISTERFKLDRVISEIQGSVEVATLSGPTDLYVTEDNYIYICDKGNNRILKLDNDLNFIMEFVKPSDETFDQDMPFLPNKLVVDDAGRVYCISDNINKGLIKYEADGTFIGFHGANEVRYNLADYIWKKLATKAQRAAMVNFVPTEYDNICMDSEGFIFACTTKVTASGVRNGGEDPVRRLNLMGKNILIENGNNYVIGDWYWDKAGGYEGPSLITDVTALDSGIYYILDKVRGRIFGYDEQGNLLFAFGGNGNQDGYFRLPIAIDHMDNDLLVLDYTDASFTLFTPNAFGRLVYQAYEEYNAGDYDASGETWKKVMELDGNYDQAYIGIGRALMRQKQYGEAMEYFKLKYDTRNYSKAFKQYRSQWVEKNIGWIVLVFLVVVILPLLIGKIRKIKFQIDTADIFKT